MSKSIHEIVTENRNMFSGLAAIYSTLCLCDLETGEYEVIKTTNSLWEHFKDIDLAKTPIGNAFAPVVKEIHRQTFIDFTDFNEVKEKLLYSERTPKIMVISLRDGGKWVNIEWLTAERDAEGCPTRAFMAVSDVDEAKRKHTREMKEIVDTVEAAHMGLWRIELFDDEMPRMKASDKMLELLGLDPKKSYSREKIYQAWHSRICPEALDSVNKSVQKMISGKQDENTYKWNHPTLGIRYVRCGGVAYKEFGRGYVLVGYHYDVTEQLKTEEEQKLITYSLANTFSCLYYIDLPNNTYVSYNNNIKNVEKFIPRTGSLTVGFNNFNKHLCQEESSEDVQKFTDLSTLNDRLKHQNRISLEFKGVTVEWCKVELMVCDRKEDGTINHMIMSVRDITAQKNNELRQIEQLKANIEANKAKTQMLQNMSHEIRTPLNAMFGFSQLLSLPDGSLNNAEKEEYFNYIYNSFNMLSMLIDDVLDLADAEHGNYQMLIGDVNVNEICRNAMQMAEGRRPANVTMQFTSDLADDLIIQSDGRRIQQVLVNYLTNACKHTQKGKIHLHVSETETPGRLTFSVTDTGEGIPAEMAENIFERFKKLNANVQGSGIGLNICSVIAEKLNAEVKLDTSYTDGARFLFII